MIDDDIAGNIIVDESMQVNCENPLSGTTSGTMDSASIDDEEETNCVGVNDFIGNISVNSEVLDTSVAIGDIFRSQDDILKSFSAFLTKHIDRKSKKEDINLNERKRLYLCPS